MLAFLYSAPIWKSTFHYLARRSLQQHDTVQALQHLQWADKLGTPSPETTLLEAQCARRNGQPEEFHRLLKMAQQRGATPTSIQRESILFAAQSGQIQLAAPHLSTLLTDTSGDNKDVCLAYITGYLRNHRIDDALVLLDAWIKDSPNDYLPWKIRGRVSKHRRDNVSAESDLRHAFQLRPDDSETLVELAELLADSSRTEEALSFFEKVTNDSSLQTRAAIGRAKCLKSLGEFEQAMNILHAEVKRTPGFAPLWLETGRLQFENAEYEEAKLSLQECLKLQPWNDEAMYVLAQCQNQLGNPDDAKLLISRVEEFRRGLAEIQTIKDGLRNNQMDSALLAELGEVLLSYSDPEEAAITLQAALDSDPKNQKAHELLAEFYGSRYPNDKQYQSLADWHRQQAVPIKSETKNRK